MYMSTMKDIFLYLANEKESSIEYIYIYTTAQSNTTFY
jgi:hypothetical protein